MATDQMEQNTTEKQLQFLNTINQKRNNVGFSPSCIFTDTKIAPAVCVRVCCVLERGLEDLWLNHANIL